MFVYIVIYVFSVVYSKLSCYILADASYCDCFKRWNESINCERYNVRTLLSVNDRFGEFDGISDSYYVRFRSVYGDTDDSVLLVSGIHGDEVDGVKILEELLRRLYLNGDDNNEYLGMLGMNLSLIIVPIANIVGWLNGSRYENMLDVNRDFVSYKVPRSFSAKMLMCLVHSNDLSLTISLHNGNLTQVDSRIVQYTHDNYYNALPTISFPWGSIDKQFIRNSDYDYLMAVLKRVDECNACNYFTYGETNDVVYSVNGSFEDWLQDGAQVAQGLTCFNQLGHPQRPIASFLIESSIYRAHKQLRHGDNELNDKTNQCSSINASVDAIIELLMFASPQIVVMLEDTTVHAHKLVNESTVINKVKGFALLGCHHYTFNNEQHSCTLVKHLKSGTFNKLPYISNLNIKYKLANYGNSKFADRYSITVEPVTD